MKVMKLPPKFITVMCLVQISFISTGYLITRSCLQFYDKVVTNFNGFPLHRVPAVLQFIRAYGAWFMLVPIVWCIIASSRGRADAGDETITPIQFIIGIGLTVTVVATYALCALHAACMAFG
jgi:hypothetical protein